MHVMREWGGIVDRETLVNRAVLNCVHFVRQYIYFLHMADQREDFEETVLTYIHNNFIDMAILGWSHLFGNHNDDLHYRKICLDADEFKVQMLKELELDDEGWKGYWHEVQTFRNKRVAHLEVVPDVIVPDLDLAYRSVAFYYGHFIAGLKENPKFVAYPDSLDEFSNNRDSKYFGHIRSIVRAV